MAKCHKIKQRDSVYKRAIIVLFFKWRENMRNVNNTDLFKVMRIVRKTGFKKRILELDVPKDEKGNVLLSDNDYFIVLLMEFIEGAPDAEDDIFKFLADIAGVSVKKMKED